MTARAAPDLVALREPDDQPVQSRPSAKAQPAGKAGGRSAGGPAGKKPGKGGDGLRAPRALPEGVISAGDMLYAIELFWQVPQSGGSTAVTAEARRTARSPGIKGDLFAIRDSSVGVTQYAIGQSRRGHRAHMPVAATTLAEATSDTFTAFFPLPDGRYWHTRCISDVIGADDDRILDEQEARDLAETIVQQGNQGVLFAPAHWNLTASYGADVDSRPLDQVLDPKNATTKLQHVAFLRNVSPKVLLGTLSFIIGLLVVFAFAYMWIEQRQQADLDAIRRNWPAPAKFTPKSQKQEARQLEQPKPWIHSPPFLTVARSCFQALDKMTISMPGYTVDNVRCNTATAYVVYRATGGNAAWLDVWLSNQPLPVALTIDHKTDRATITEPIIAKARGPQPLWAGRLVYHNLTSLLQTVSSAPSIVPVPPPPPPADPKEAENAPPPPPPAVKFSAKLNVPLNDVAVVLDHIPGAMFEQIEFDVKARQWSLNGVIYHEP